MKGEEDGGRERVVVCVWPAPPGDSGGRGRTEEALAAVFVCVGGRGSRVQFPVR